MPAKSDIGKRCPRSAPPNTHLGKKKLPSSASDFSSLLVDAFTGLFFVCLTQFRFAHLVSTASQQKPQSRLLRPTSAPFFLSRRPHNEKGQKRKDSFLGLTQLKVVILLVVLTSLPVCAWMSPQALSCDFRIVCCCAKVPNSWLPSALRFASQDSFAPEPGAQLSRWQFPTTRHTHTPLPSQFTTTNVVSCTLLCNISNDFGVNLTLHRELSQSFCRPLHSLTEVPNASLLNKVAPYTSPSRKSCPSNYTP